jgi:hypothetical protein
MSHVPRLLLLSPADALSFPVAGLHPVIAPNAFGGRVRGYITCLAQPWPVDARGDTGHEALRPPSLVLLVGGYRPVGVASRKKTGERIWDDECSSKVPISRIENRERPTGLVGRHRAWWA